MPDAAEYCGARLKDISGSAIGAGFLAVVVSYAGPLLIYLSAADSNAISTETFSSWIFAISIAAGISSIVLSLCYRAPVAMAWSAPGTVLLISLGTSLSISEVVGAYIIVALVLVVIGVSGVFERLVRFLPPSVTNGMMAGILFGFCMKAASGLSTDPVTVVLLIAIFGVCTVVLPGHAMLLLLGAAIVISAFFHGASLGSVGFELASPEITAPDFSAEAMLGLTLPLLITTLSGQYLPGIAILRSHGYTISANPILVIGGIASVGAALFGGITTALASITAAFCAGPDSHEEPGRRYVSGVVCGVFFCVGGVLAVSIVDILILMPSSLITLLAGLALLQPTLKFTAAMLASDNAQAGLMTFMFTASGVTLFGIGAAFWGIVVGVSFHFLTKTVNSWTNPFKNKN
ncbi:Inner membrane protein YdcO (plasmid) [Marinibacterium anthonyi]|nr:Inner membrane protein YdcO [Marinibacterium anthonyi]